MSAVTVRGLHKRYGGREVLRGLDLDLPAGALGLLLGPNGAGKTTTLRLLAGLERPGAGTFTLLGAAPGPGLRSGVALTLEDPRFYPHLSARDNLRVVAEYRRLPQPGAWAAEVLETVGLTHAARQTFGRLSLGMRQRLHLASTLVPGLQLLLLDEPTNGLDVEGREGVWDVLRGLRARGVSVLVSTHAVLEAEKHADHLTVLHGGRRVYGGTLTELRAGRGLLLDVADPQGAAGALGAAGYAAQPDPAGEGRVRVAAPAEALPSVLTRLSAAGHPAHAARPEDLEDLYWRLTAHA